MSLLPTSPRELPITLRIGLYAAAFVAIGGAIWMITMVAAPLASLIVAVLVAVVLCSLLVPVQVFLNHKLRLPPPWEPSSSTCPSSCR